VAARGTLHGGKNGARDVNETEDVAIEQLTGIVDENIDTSEPVDRLRDRLAHLVLSSDVELEDERLRRVALDQVADSLRRPSRDDGSPRARTASVSARPRSADDPVMNQTRW
jgi:hypothetical protein